MSQFGGVLLKFINDLLYLLFTHQLVGWTCQRSQRCLQRWFHKTLRHSTFDQITLRYHSKLKCWNYRYTTMIAKTNYSRHKQTISTHQYPYQRCFNSWGSYGMDAVVITLRFTCSSLWWSHSRLCLLATVSVVLRQDKYWIFFALLLTAQVYGRTDNLWDMGE